MRAGVSAGSQPKGFSELKGVNHRFFTQIMPMNPGAGIYESADNRNLELEPTDHRSHKKAPTKCRGSHEKNGKIAFGQ